MSHNVEKMMYTGKKPWWYGTSAQGSAVGVYVGDVAVSAERAIKEAGLDWDVLMAQAGFADGTVDVDGRPVWSEAGHHRMLVRSSDRSVLGWCSGNHYRPIQNREAFDFLDSLVDDGALAYHTAGSLEGGKRVWILAQTPESWTVRRRSGATNTHHAFLLTMLGHDGGSGFKLMPTDVRAECANTCGYAEEGAAAAFLSFNIGHTGDVAAKLKLAATAIRTMIDQTPEKRAVLQSLAQAAMSSGEFIDFATGVFLGLDGEAGEVKEAIDRFYSEATEQTRKNMAKRVDEVGRLFGQGIGAEGDSAYDALQAFTEYFDHFDIEAVRSKVELGKRAAKAVTSSWIGIGAERKALALKRLTQMVSR